MTREPLTIVFERRASLEIETIEAWWRANRPAAPELFLQELERALDAVAIVPELGASAMDARLEGVRRVLLGKTRYYVYYRRAEDAIHILAVWHASRVGPVL